MEIEFDVAGMESFVSGAKEIKLMGVENGVRKQIGVIFTPSSSSSNITNAIQVCGFYEAFDLWGCSRFSHLDKCENALVKAIEGKRKEVQTKDIQLLFDFDNKRENSNIGAVCEKCYNSPCHCDYTINGNAYIVKREKDLKGSLEYVKEE